MREKKHECMFEHTWLDMCRKYNRPLYYGDMRLSINSWKSLLKPIETIESSFQRVQDPRAKQSIVSSGRNQLRNSQVETDARLKMVEDSQSRWIPAGANIYMYLHLVCLVQSTFIFGSPPLMRPAISCDLLRCR